MNPHLYEIRLEENLDNRWSGWFEGMEIIPIIEGDRVGSLLRGCLPDQAALFGLLGRVRDLNLTLLEVRRIT